jgi:hypothetical protein
MSTWEKLALHDIQPRANGRNLRIDAVDVKGVRYPVTNHAEEGPT